MVTRRCGWRGFAVASLACVGLCLAPSPGAAQGPPGPFCGGGVTTNCIDTLTVPGSPANITASLSVIGTSATLAVLNTSNANQYELASTLGTGSALEIKLILGFTPRVVVGAGNITDWTLGGGTTTVNVKPLASSWNQTTGCNPVACATTAESNFGAIVNLIIDSMDSVSADLKSAMNGGYIGTNGQYFVQPSFIGGAIQFQLGAPHFLAPPNSTTVNTGFFRVLLPTAVITQLFNVLDPNTLVAANKNTVTVGGTSFDLTPTAVSGGLLYELSGFSYSVPTVTIAPKAANTAPTITDIGNQAINENGATAALAFTVGDTETAAGSLTVSGSSSNTALVPDANIVFGGSGASRTVTVTPAANQIGTATITVSVSDGSLSASDTFTLTVNATANFAPTISGLTQSVTINEDTATSALTFTIDDRETAAANLELSARSSNVALVATANIVFGGSGASRTVTITPAANQNGQVTITVMVSDGTLTTSDNLTLTVTAVNDAPTISGVAHQTIDEDGTTGALSLTISDTETAASSLTLAASSSSTTLVPTANIVFGGSGASRTVTVTPAANQNGSATITVTVSDGSTSASDSFTVTVNAVNDAPTIAGPASQTTSPGVVVGPLAITVGDVETAAAHLTLTGASSNTTLVPAANLAFGGSGTARTVTVTPAAGSVGNATLTLTVGDGASSTSATFTLAVRSTLTLEKTGSGVGTIGTTTDPTRCGSSCTATYESAGPVRLVAIPDPQASFAGWGGDDDCLDGVVSMSANRTCRARFTQVPAGGLLDLNGDRIGDVFSYDSTTGNRTEWIADAAGGFSSTTGGWSPGWVVRAADFDLNGHSDLFLYNPADGQWFQVLKTGSSYQYINGTWSAGWSVQVADFNRDGRSDVFLYNPVDGVWIIAFAAAEGGFTYSSSGQWSARWEIYPTEYDGDGLTDLFLYNAESGRWFWVLNTGQGPGIAPSGGSDAALYVSGLWSPDWDVVAVDLSADRRTDFLLYNRTTGGWVQARNRGSGFDYVSGTWDRNWSVQAGDFNGDRRDDVFLYNESTGGWVEALIDSSGGFTYYQGTWDAGWRIVPASFNTAGRTGLFLYGPTRGAWVRATPAGPGAFSYVNGTFGTGLSLAVTVPRAW